MFDQQILHVGLVILVARECRVELRQVPMRHHLFQFLPIQEVSRRISLTKEQPIAARRSSDPSFMQEAAEGRNSRSGTNHDDRSSGILWQSEFLIRVNNQWQPIAHLDAFVEQGGTYASTVPIIGTEADNRDCRVHLPGVGQRAGRYRVEPRRELRQEPNQLVSCLNDARAVFEEINQVAAVHIGLEFGLLFRFHHRVEPRALSQRCVL
jgi:hypothetical protein